MNANKKFSSYFMITLFIISTLSVAILKVEPVQALPSDFTIIALPDTQNYCTSYPAIFTAQTQWIANNKDTLNIKFVVHEGDIVNTATSTTEWGNADTSMTILDTNNVPYSIVPGNHDHEGGSTSGATTLYNTHFPYTRYETKYWWGGHYPSGGNDNNYQLMTIGCDDYLFLSLDYDASSDEIAWANSVLDTYPNRKVILTTHSYLQSDGSRTSSGTNIWNNLVYAHSNIQLVLCGHVHTETRRTDNNVAGKPVYQLLADYQDAPNGGNGWLRILTFVPSEDKIYVKTYSPSLNSYDIDAGSQFTLDYDMCSPGWTAYNDCAHDPAKVGVATAPNGKSVLYIGSHVTTYGIGTGLIGSSSGLLLDQATGASTGVTATLTQNGNVYWQTDTSSSWTSGYDPAAGTDADDTFGGIADMTGLIGYGSSGWYVDLTFTGLDPEKEYTFATSSARCNPSYTTRITVYALTGADTYTQASTPGVTVISANQVKFCTGNNYNEGYVARWTHVTSGADGSFTVRATAAPESESGYKAYSFDVFMLQECCEVTEPLPPPEEWTAYIDLNAYSHGNHINVVEIVPTGVYSGGPPPTPFFSPDPPTGIVLKDYDTGVNLPVTMDMAYQVQYPTTNGVDSDPATDAGVLFGGIVNGKDNYEIKATSGDYVTLTFNNLNPTKKYVVAMTYNRGGASSYANRATRFTILGADTFTQASSSGVVVNAPSSVSFSTGYNTINGYVARWTDVTAADGVFSIKSEQDISGSWSTGSTGYAMTSIILQQVTEPLPPPEEWTAYIDLNAYSGGNHPNVLEIVPIGIYSTGVTSPPFFSPDPPTGKVLKDYDTGVNLPVTMDLAYQAQYPTDNGADSNGGTDAYNLFGGIVNGQDGYEITASTGDYMTVTFNNLDPSEEYVVAMTYNRNNAAYTNRATRFTILGADTYTQASTSGVVVNSPSSVSFCTGANTVNGYVARWTGVMAADGVFSIKSEQDTSGSWDGSKGYAMTSIVLQQVSEPTTTCATTSTYYTTETDYTTVTDYSFETSVTTETDYTTEIDYTVETSLTTETDVTTSTDYTVETSMITETNMVTETDHTTETDVTTISECSTDTIIQTLTETVTQSASTETATTTETATETVYAAIEMLSGEVHAVVGGTSGATRGKPAGTVYAAWIDSTAGGVLLGMSEAGHLCWDTDTSYIDPSTGEPTGVPAGATLVASGGPLVNGPVKYYEVNRITEGTPAYYAKVGGLQSFLRSSDDSVLAGLTPTSTNDLFIIEIFTDSEGRNIILIYGLAGRGTLAGALYFADNADYFDGKSGFWIYEWTDSGAVGAEGHPDPPGTDTYTQITSG